jgi:DNA-binding beta-propeller fold protein YncE
MRASFLLATLGAAALAACGNKASTDAPAPTVSAASPAMSASNAAAPPKKVATRPPPREGSALARSANDDALYLADEDHDVVRVIALPFDGAAPPTQKEIPTAGHPAQVLVTQDRVLVTVRDPGELRIFAPDAEKGLIEKGRVAVPGDAWGVAIAPDGKTAIVTSAWANQVSAVDIASAKKLWSVPVSREPRAVVVRPDGLVAYVTHLTGSRVTRIEGLNSATPTVTAVELPPAPARTPSGKTLDAALGYSAALSPDGSRLFAARHAIGALGRTLWGETWYGAPTVDVLVTKIDKPLLEKRTLGMPKARRTEMDMRGKAGLLPTTGADFGAGTQPRAMVYRVSTRTLLVASEGLNQLVEMEADSTAPALSVVRTHDLAASYEKFMHIAVTGGAPSAIALSDDESLAYVFCRSTYDLAVVKLNEAKSQVAVARLAEDTLGKDGSMGRRLFYDATDPVMSGALACNGCHPEGRDDGHVWHEATFGDRTVFFGEPENSPDTLEHDIKGIPRQTPMLVGHVKAQGPYGWKAQAKDLTERLREGFRLHRWSGDMSQPAENEIVSRATFLTVFARKGLVLPPREDRALTAEEQRGKAIFMGEPAHCSKCHDPQTDFTDRAVYPLGHVPPPTGFEDEKTYEFKTPSLIAVGNSGPYFHDGRASTLEFLIESNNDRMGKTNQLSKDDKAALVAYLRTL